MFFRVKGFVTCECLSGFEMIEKIEMIIPLSAVEGGKIYLKAAVFSPS